MENVVEYFIEKPSFVYSKEFYCTKCKSAVVEHFDDEGFYATEWIDFNV